MWLPHTSALSLNLLLIESYLIYLPSLVFSSTSISMKLNGTKLTEDALAPYRLTCMLLFYSYAA